jgi:hypothetical protein
VTFSAFADEDWQAIRLIRADWPDGIDWVKARSKIENTGRTYWYLHEGRSRFGPPAKVRVNIERLLRRTRKLNDDTKAALPEKLRLYFLNGDRDLDVREKQLMVLLSFYERWTGPDFSGRSDYYRDWLYEALLDDWATLFHGELSFSRKLDQTPYGPLIDFLRLTLMAILGRETGPSGIAKIIEKYR